MVVRIRLARHGRRNRPYYHIVAANAQAPRDGRFLEQLGTYDPLVNPKSGVKIVRINTDRFKYWLAVGAQPSLPVTKLMSKFHVLPSPPIPSRLPAYPQPPSLSPSPILAKLFAKRNAAADFNDARIATLRATGNKKALSQSSSTATAKQ